jgi:alkylation response protein AidB-like acyl-CoA dehydrogenase
LESSNIIQPTPESANRPSLDELASRARALQPVLREAARATEANRRVSPATMGLLEQAELLSLVKPREYGGLSYGPSAMLPIGFELGRACGSTAWCAMIGNCNAWFTAYWPREAQDEVWKDRPGNLVAGAVAPGGGCEAAEGGYYIHGKWPFASNCDNSQWIFVSSMMPEMDGIPAGVGWFLVPSSLLEIDHNTWRVAGLQGTGSKTVIAEKPIFVPNHRVIRFGDIGVIKTPGAAIAGNVMARFSFSTFAAVALISPILGMAQGTLDWFTANLRGKQRVNMRPGPAVMASDNAFAQERAGRASAAIEGSMALVKAALAPAEEAVFAGNLPSVEQRLRVRQAIGFAARQCVDAVNILYEGSGASSGDLDSPIQRHWRDLNFAARHISLDVQAINSLVGQHLFGMQPTGAF